MADNFAFVGGQTSYVPTLSAGLIVDFSRNVQTFALPRYVGYRPVDKMVGYYTYFKNTQQARVVDVDRFAFPDKADLPQGSVNNSQHEFKQYSCQRYAYAGQLGYLEVEQGSWDLLDKESRDKAQQAMTARTKRCMDVLTTSANWSGNVGTMTALAGGQITSATSTNPYVRKLIMTVANTIMKNTVGKVRPTDLHIVCNPNTAAQIAQSQEFIDFVKQQSTVYDVWTGNGKWNNTAWYLPEKLFGLNFSVEDAVYVSTVANASSDTFNYVLPDGDILFLSNVQGINPAAGPAFSTVELMLYGDFSLQTFNDTKNKRYDFWVEENTAEVLVAPLSGYLVTAAY